jgi:hypothetical protein
MANKLHIEKAGEFILEYPGSPPEWVSEGKVPRPVVGPDGSEYTFEGLVVIRRWKLKDGLRA